jgi:SAM-dependent methyltransferase
VAAVMLRKAISIFRSQGPTGLARSALRKLRGGRMRRFETVRQLVQGKVGLEIGGPSKYIFGQLVPIYHYASQVDNCNFATKTIWEASVVEGRTFAFSSEREPGMQYVCDASNLSHIPDHSYDFVMSSHVIEHIANPIRALNEWRRTLKPGGTAIFVVPHRNYTFDRRRPLTTLQHMIEDFERSVGEDDQTHLEETLGLIDYAMIPYDREQLAALGRDVINTRALHHHTFNEHSFCELLTQVGFDILHVAFEPPHQIIAIAKTNTGLQRRLAA